MSEHHNIIVIGAGLSGVYAAWRLQKMHRDVIVLESRNRTGGRILSAEYNNARFDMGPAWLWPEFQPHLHRLIIQLNLDIFKQFTTGDLLYEKSLAAIERYSDQSAHTQSYRIAGGAQCLIEAMQSELLPSCIHLNTFVQSIHMQNLHIHTLREGKSYDYTADKIILALPPRLTLEKMTIEPGLPGDIVDAWNAIPTWMAAQSKLIFICDNPFWREQNLSGEVFSHVGPLSEIYDASPINEEYYALTSFAGLNALQRRQITEKQFIDACLAQLQRLFGEIGHHILDILIKDWSLDKDTTTKPDLTGPVHHPYYPDEMPRSFWNNALILAGTEVAREHAGYLEGALISSDNAISLCTDTANRD